MAGSQRCQLISATQFNHDIWRPARPRCGQHRHSSLAFWRLVLGGWGKNGIRPPPRTGRLEGELTIATTFTSGRCT